MSCHKTPLVVVGGALQFTRQCLRLLTPFTQLLPGSVTLDPLLSAGSARPPFMRALPCAHKVTA